MPSCQERIADAMFSAMEGVASQYGKNFASKQVKVERNRFDALAEDELPSLILYESDPIPSEDFSSEDGYTAPFTIQGAVEGKGEDARTRGNALRAELLTVLFADRTLGGLARYLELTPSGDVLAAETPAAETQGFLIGVNVGYATKESDPYTFEHE